MVTNLLCRFLIVSAHLVQVRSDISEKLFAVFFLSNFYCLLSDFLTNHVTLSSLFYVSRKSRDIQAVILTTHNSFFILPVFWCVSKITWHFTRYLMCLRNHLAVYPLLYVFQKSMGILPVVFFLCVLKITEHSTRHLYVSEITKHTACCFMGLRNHGALHLLFYVSRKSRGILPIIL